MSKLYDAKGQPLDLQAKRQTLLALAQMGQALVQDHTPILLVGARLTTEEGSLQVMVPTQYIPLIQNSEFRDVLVEAIRAQLEEMSKQAVVVEAQAESVTEDKASEYQA